jgi:putative DNA primase/helicase
MTVGWFQTLSLDENGSPRGILNNIATILAKDSDWSGVLGFNERASDIVFLRKPPFSDFTGPESSFPRRLIDADYGRVETWLQGKLKIDCVRYETVTRACELVARDNTFDPFRDYLRGLPPWDGISRAHFWLIHFGGAENRLVVREMSARWLLSIVARTLEPGCKADHVLVLDGPQGMMKSSLLEALLPDSDLFLDDLPAPTSKDAKLLLHGPVIVELAELAALRRAENEHIKAFLTTKVDRLRPPYGRATAKMPRRCVFAATTNEVRYLKDPTGNRRYWPVTVTRANPAGLAAVRDQLWAEVLVGRNLGFKHFFERAEWEALAGQEQAERLETDPWEEVLIDYVQRRELAMALLVEAERANDPNERRATLQRLNEVLLSDALSGCLPPQCDELANARARVEAAFGLFRGGPPNTELYQKALRADPKTR